MAFGPFWPNGGPALCTGHPNLEKLLGTPARIYFKNESVSAAGSHKPNSAVAQAWYNKQAGTKKMTTETGAGQWGSALSFACAQVGLELKVFMVRVSFRSEAIQKNNDADSGGRIAFPAHPM